MCRAPAASAFLISAMFVTACGADPGSDRDGDRSSRFPEPRSIPDAACMPHAGGPYWVLEGEAVLVTVSCSSGMPREHAELEVGALPEGAAWDAASGEISWTPTLDQAAVYELSLTAMATGETATVKIGVADAWGDPSNVPIVDPLRYTEEFGLPVFFLSPVPLTKEYVPATVVHGGHVYEAEAKVRGAASLDYPKLSYTFKFTKEDKFQEPSRDFRDKRKINLHSGFDDNSYMRNRLAFDTWNRMDPGHIRMQSYSAVLYLDGEYWGLYTIIDHINGFLMEDHGYDQEGDIFKAVDPEANFGLYYGGSRKSTPHEGYEKTEGLPLEGEPDAFRDLDEIIHFVEQSGDASFRAELTTWVDLRDYQDWWILSVLLFANDSVNKNSYHYQDAGAMRFIPWDYNASFGQNWRTVRRDPDEDDDFTDENRLFERLRLDPAMRTALDTRYAHLLESRVPVHEMLERIDVITREIERSARRDEQKWGDEYRTFFRWVDRVDFKTWEEEAAYVREWTEARWQIEAERVHTRLGGTE